MKPLKAKARRAPLILYGEEVDFDADVWVLRNETPGAHQKLSTVDWRVKLHSGERISDYKLRNLLVELKTVLETRILDPREGSSPAASSAGLLGQGLCVVAKWMVSTGRSSLADIDNDSSWEFVDYLAGTDDEVLEGFEDDLNDYYAEPQCEIPSLRFSTAIRCLNAVSTIYKQRRALESRGVPFIMEAPFDGRTPHSVVTQELGLSRDGRLLPIPDDVAVPTLNAAMRLIGLPAQDVIALSRLHEPLRSKEVMEGDRIVPYEAYRTGITRFPFSTLSGERGPWHQPIEGSPRWMLDGRRVFVKKTQRVRRLVLMIVEACTITIQGLTGIRAHELIGAKVADTCDSVLPSTVSMERSKDQTTELFYFNAETFKGKRKKTRWLLGSRLAGSSYEPPPVQAFRVLEELLAPWRALAGTNALLLTFIPSQGLPRKAKSIGKMTSGTLSCLMKEFVAEYVDLSRASSASKEEFLVRNSIRAHRWRPTFALYLFRMSPDLLPAISDHFKHMNVSITEDGYIGNDPSLIGFCDSARVQTSAEFLLEITSPGAKIAGGATHFMSQNSERIRELIGNEPGASLIERAVSFVESRELYIYNAAYAHCLVAFRPRASRCNQMSGGADWRRPFPNDTYRSLSTCMGCELLALSPRHADFFRERAEKNEILAKQSESSGEIGVAKLARARARQSRLILGKLGDEVL